MIPKIVFVLLAFFVADGMEVVSRYTLSFDFLFFKHDVLLYFFAILAGLILLGIREGRISYKVLLFLLFFSILFLCVSLRDLMVFSSLHATLMMQLYSILIFGVVMSEFHKRYNFDTFAILFRVVSIISLLLLLKLFLVHDTELMELVSIYNEKLITHLGFVNSFSYVCAFGILCGFLSWLREDKKEKRDLKQAGIYLMFFIFPLLVLLISKSKGGAAIVILGSLFLFLRLRVIVFVSGLIGLFSLVISQTWPVDIFYKFMMFGRTAPEYMIEEKVWTAFTSRFGASKFFQDPLTFLSQHPFGVGLRETMNMTYEIPGYDLIQGNHSLLMILWDSYGLLTLIFLIVILNFTSISLSPNFLLGICMLSVPVIFTNGAKLSYAIPLMVLASNIRIHRRIPRVSKRRLAFSAQA